MPQPKFKRLLFACSACVFLVTGCGYNAVIERDEEVKQAWSEVENQYQRRLDLIPNLVQTVKGAAAQEQNTLISVVEARSKVAGVKVDADMVNDPERLRAFEASQRELSGSLSRLLVVVEKYPELKSSGRFQELQGQLEGTENRIAVARRRFTEAVSAYNKTVLAFPSSIGAKMRGKDVRPNFASVVGADKAPEVKF